MKSTFKIISKFILFRVLDQVGLVAKKTGLSMKSNSKFMQGKYKVKNRSKYKGNPDNVMYRSSWELKLFNWLDNNPNIIQFSSEEYVVPYLSPLDGRIHRYFPDVYVKVRNKDGIIKEMLIEVKPEKQVNEPVKKSRITKSYITEVTTYAVNQSKWKAAKEYCADRGWEFRIMTEKHLGVG